MNNKMDCYKFRKNLELNYLKKRKIVNDLKTELQNLII